MYNNITSSADIKDYVNKYAHFEMIINNRESCRLFTVIHSAWWDGDKSVYVSFLNYNSPNKHIYIASTVPACSLA